MEILQNILTFLLGAQDNPAFERIYKTFERNGFDLVATLKSMDFTTLIQTIIQVVSSINSAQNKNPTEQSVGCNSGYDYGCNYGLNPIACVADKDIVYTLNKYFNNA